MIHKTFNTLVPDSNTHEYDRLLSIDNVSYFTDKNTVILCEKQIDKVESNIRILCHYLIHNKCKIYSFFAPDNNLAKEQLNSIWNNIKKEEKIIKKEGLTLFYSDGSSVLYKDSSYRVVYPSHESFLYEYPIASQKQHIMFGMPTNNDIFNIIKDRNDLFDNNLKYLGNENDYQKYLLSFNCREYEFSQNIWRRYTENIVSIMSLKEEKQSL